MNLDVAQTVAGECIDDIVVSTIRPSDKNNTQDKTTHHTQACENCASLLPENVPECYL